MQRADIEQYEAMITALTKFKDDVSAECGVMVQSMEDCVDGTYQDPNVVSTSASLFEKVQKIVQSLSEVDGLIAALRAEADEIQQPIGTD